MQLVGHELGAFALPLSTCVALLVCVIAAYRNTRLDWAMLFGVGAVFCATIVAASLGYPSRSALMHIVNSKVTSLLFLAGAVLLGILISQALMAREKSPRQRLAALAVYVGGVAILSILAIKPLLSSPPVAAEEKSTILRSGRVTVESLTTFPEFYPTALAIAPDGVVYIAGYEGGAMQGGIVQSLRRLPDGKTKLAAVAAGLTRPHGIAFHNGDLFISRSGQFARAIGGKMAFENTGAITRLRDLNNDGYFELYEDVLAGLPGDQDGTFHQNNGLVFSPQGLLYAAIGTPGDHAMSPHPYAGTILEIDVESGETQVVARGFRNPYGVCFGPGGKLFGTDNDAGNNPDDELNVIERGAHYGHPYDATDEPLKISGVRQPLLRMSVLEGLTYVPAGALPAGFDDCLYVADLGGNQILRVTISSTADGLAASAEPLCEAQGVTDVKFSAEERALYACSFMERTIYRVTIGKEAAAQEATK